MHFQLLGPLRICTRHGEIPVPAARQRSLLAALLLRANETVPLGELMTRIWADAPPRDARATTQTNVHRLRCILRPDVIRSQAGGPRTRRRRPASSPRRWRCGAAPALTAEHPLREGFWAQLMVALAGSGRPVTTIPAGWPYEDTFVVDW